MTLERPDIFRPILLAILQYQFSRQIYEVPVMIIMTG